MGECKSHPVPGRSHAWIESRAPGEYGKVFCTFCGEAQGGEERGGEGSRLESNIMEMRTRMEKNKLRETVLKSEQRVVVVSHSFQCFDSSGSVVNESEALNELLVDGWRVLSADTLFSHRDYDDHMIRIIVLYNLVRSPGNIQRSESGSGNSSGFKSLGDDISCVEFFRSIPPEVLKASIPPGVWEEVRDFYRLILDLNHIPYEEDASLADLCEQVESNGFGSTDIPSELQERIIQGFSIPTEPQKEENFSIRRYLCRRS